MYIVVSWLIRNLRLVYYIRNVFVHKTGKIYKFLLKTRDLHNPDLFAIEAQKFRFKFDFDEKLVFDIIHEIDVA